MNYDFLQLPEEDWVLGDRDYLIITKPQFESTLGPFRTWLIQHGMTCFIITTTEIPGGCTPENIWSYIRKTWEGYDLKYVLLVGDFNAIPPKLYPRENEYGSYPNVPSDHYYACIYGNDSIPDISVGRLGVSTTSQLNGVLNRITSYRNGTEPSAWPRRVLLVAHKEQRIIKDLDFEWCKDRINNGSYPLPRPTFLKRYGRSGYRNSDLVAEIDTGCGIVNYSGHGNESAWTHWNQAEENWTDASLYDLHNGLKSPVIFSMACKNAALYGPNLAESWLGYAVSSIGATTTSMSPESNELDERFYDGVYQGQTGPTGRPVGRALDYAKCEMIKAHCWILDPYRYILPGRTRDEIRKFLVLGDPSMPVRRTSLGILEVVHPNDVHTGFREISIQVRDGAAVTPIEHAVVCLSKSSEVYVAGTSDSSGNITFEIDASSPGEIAVTVSRENYVPYSGIITVIP